MTLSDQVTEVGVKYLAEVGAEKVPAGYKQTEVGVIPEDWDCKPFGNLFEINVIRKSIKQFDFVSFVGMHDVSESAQLSKSSIVKYGELKNGLTYFGLRRFLNIYINNLKGM